MPVPINHRHSRRRRRHVHDDDHDDEDDDDDQHHLIGAGAAACQGGREMQRFNCISCSGSTNQFNSIFSL